MFVPSDSHRGNRGELMKPRKTREKVIAEITATHLRMLMQEQGKFLDQQQALAFLNEGDRAYIMWKQMMTAGENYIKSVLTQIPQSSAEAMKSGPTA